MNYYESGLDWTAWTILLAPGFVIYYLNRTKVITDHLAYSLLLFAPALVTQIPSYPTHLSNLVPVASAAAIFYFAHWAESTDKKRKAPRAFPMLAVMFGFSLLITLAVSATALPPSLPPSDQSAA